MRSRLINRLLARPLRQSQGWICQRSSFQFQSRWQSFTQTSSESGTKPYYITSPIFYVNGGNTSEAQGRVYKCTNMLYSTSHRPPLYTRPDGHPEEMECFAWQKIYTRHGDRRAWNESVLETYLSLVGLRLIVCLDPKGSCRGRARSASVLR